MLAFGTGWVSGGVFFRLMIEHTISRRPGAFCGGMRREAQAANGVFRLVAATTEARAGLVGHRAPQLTGKKTWLISPVPLGTAGVRQTSPVSEERKRARRRWHTRLDVEVGQIPPSLPASPRWAQRGEILYHSVSCWVFLA